MRRLGTAGHRVTDAAGKFRWKLAVVGNGGDVFAVLVLMAGEGLRHQAGAAALAAHAPGSAITFIARIVSRADGRHQCACVVKQMQGAAFVADGEYTHFAGAS